MAACGRELPREGSALASAGRSIFAAVDAAHQLLREFHSQAETTAAEATTLATFTCRRFLHKQDGRSANQLNI
jgi:hypothetical protein